MSQVYSITRLRTLAFLTASALLSGCATMDSHDKLASDLQASSRSEGIPSALARLEATATSEDDKKALLYNLERGELLRLDNRYDESTQSFLLADEKINEWEAAAKTDPGKLMGVVGAALISERFKAYEGQDYEKVFLTTRLALNRIAANDLDKARVDIKRTHEREAVIAEFRAKELADAEAEAESKGATKGGKELDGYPVETLNDPEVLELKNGYSNALSHYLSGFLYEILNEPGLAAPGYRKAIELKPNAPVLEEGLRGLDKRTGFTWKRKQQMTDVLFLLEAGDAPARKPQGFTLPIPTGRGMVSASISYPVIQPSTDPLLTKLGIDSQELALDRVVDVNVMARRSLKDEMPGLILRSTTRVITKAAAQDQLQKNAGVLGALVGIAASAVTEQADDRMWRMLPGRIYIARGYLPPGEHRLSINGQTLETAIRIDGQYALVPLRIYGDRVALGQVASIGKLPLLPPAATTPATGKTRVKPVIKRNKAARATKK